MDVARLHGVGPKKLDGLHSLGIDDLYGLLTHYPRRYVDRTNEARIAELTPGEEAMVIGKVSTVSSRRVRGGRVMVTATLRDDSGSLRCTFFNQPWRERQLGSSGQEVAVFGKVESFNGVRQMTNPVVDLIGNRTGRVVAIYPLTEKSRLSTWDLADWVAQVLRRCAVRGIADPVPDAVLDQLDLVHRDAAFAGIHAPESMAHMVVARQRLVFDELLRLQLALVQRKADLERTESGIAHVVRDDEGPAPGVQRAFLASLPYELTNAQQRVIDEITADLASPVPMHRLLQGDVGAGKTVVAVAALLVAVQGGHQGVLMAPTEVLAEQHAASVRSLLEGFVVAEPGSLLGQRPLHVALLTNRTRAADRRRVLAGLADGTIDLAIGTHALDPGGHRVPLVGGRRGRRTAPVRGRAARRAAGDESRRAGAGPVGHDRDTHPADRRDDGLRRPGRVGARRTAARSHADPHQLGPRRRRRGRRMATRAGTGGGRAPGLRGVSPDRRSPTSSRSRRPRRPSSGWPPTSSAACDWVCCTGGSPRRTSSP